MAAVPTNAKVAPSYVDVVTDECSPGMAQELTSQGDVECMLCGNGSRELEACAGCPRGLECDAPGLSVSGAVTLMRALAHRPHSIGMRPCLIWTPALPRDVARPTCAGKAGMWLSVGIYGSAF